MFFKTLQRVYKYVFRYWFTFIVSIILFFVASGTEVWAAHIFGTLVETLTEGNYTLAYRETIKVIIITTGFVFSLAAAYQFADHTFLRAAKDLRSDIFRHIHALDFGYHVKKSSGSLISLFKRGENAYYTFAIFTNMFNLRIFLFLVILFTLLFITYPKIAFAYLAIILVNAIIMPFTLGYNLKMRRLLNDVEDDVTAITVDNMIGFDTVKYFSKEEYEAKKLDSLLQTRYEHSIKYSWGFRIIDIVNGGIIAIGGVAILLFVYEDFVAGRIGVSTLVSVIAYSTLLKAKLIALVFNLREVAKSFVDLETYVGIFDEEIEVRDGTSKDSRKKLKNLSESDYTIEYKDVSFRYEDGSNVLNNFNLDIKSGESVAFVGKSGAGKTTLTKLLLRFFDPTEGEILVGGIDIKDLSKSDYRSKIGIVPQDPILFNTTILRNIKYGRPSASKAEVVEALRKANLLDFVQSLPKGLNTIVGERGIKLSGGQKQRLAIARVILEDAPIIILDEATSSLDSESEKLIQDAFWKVSKNKTTIVIAHRLSTIQQADRIIVLEDGKIVEAGTHTDLSDKKDGLYKYLWNLQTQNQL